MSYIVDENQVKNCVYPNEDLEGCPHRLPCGICRVTNKQCPKIVVENPRVIM